ncbi:MAG TPA: hypothetical protein DHU96_13175 [Actinobacteria bacterium]|nr:hypothetical protein [Actinomycetota bacterium]
MGYGGISQATAVRGPGKSGGLLRAPCGPVAFWTPQWMEILMLLELLAVPVSSVITKLRRQDLH